MRTHTYRLAVKWTGNRGSGTSDYRAYGRDHEISHTEKASSIPASADPAFRGDRSRWSPEELLVAALSSCHMLWFLHLCADRGVTVIGYSDEPVEQMAEHDDGAGEFTEVTLRPRVRLQSPDRSAELAAIHEQAHEKCFIARTVRCEVRVEPV